MANTATRYKLTATQEVNYMCAYIGQFQKFFLDMADISLFTEIIPVRFEIEHELLMPLIDNALEHGVYYVNRPEIAFNLKLDATCLTLSTYYLFNAGILDERPQATYIKLKHKLENKYPQKHVLYRSYHQDTYVVFLKLELS